MVGETLKGPAFEPIFIRNFDEFQTIFGGTTPEKFVNTQIPKYEAAYIAKAYLQQSSQLFVSRILGLSGYDAGPAWSIKTAANVNPSTIGADGAEVSSLQLFFSAVGNTQQTSSSDYTYQFDEVQLTNELPEIAAQLDIPYTKLDGSTSTLRSDIYDFLS